MKECVSTGTFCLWPDKDLLFWMNLHVSLRLLSKEIRGAPPRQGFHQRSRRPVLLLHSWRASWRQNTAKRVVAGPSRDVWEDEHTPYVLDQHAEHWRTIDCGLSVNKIARGCNWNQAESASYGCLDSAVRPRRPSVTAVCVHMCKQNGGGVAFMF